MHFNTSDAYRIEKLETAVYYVIATQYQTNCAILVFATFFVLYYLQHIARFDERFRDQ